MKFGRYVALQLKFALASSLVVGLVLAIVVLLTGGVEGSITLDIDISRADIVWFIVGAPALITLLFLMFAPVSFFAYTAISRVWKTPSSKCPPRNS